jgi:ADP-heptose:LPS heptosyltransferase
MISMDSANMHMASLVGTPVVSIWGATHPFAGFMGWGQDPNNAIQLDMDCRPCSIFGNKPCKRGDYACLNGISPKQVLEHIEALLK